MMLGLYDDDITAMKIAAAVRAMKDDRGEGCRPVVYLSQDSLPGMIELDGAPVRRSWAVKPGQVFLVDEAILDTPPFPLGGPPVGPV